MKKYANKVLQDSMEESFKWALGLLSILFYSFSSIAKCNIRYQIYWALLKAQINKSWMVVLITNDIS